MPNDPNDNCRICPNCRKDMTWQGIGTIRYPWTWSEVTGWYEATCPWCSMTMKLSLESVEDTVSWPPERWVGTINGRAVTNAETSQSGTADTGDKYHYSARKPVCNECLDLDMAQTVHSRKCHPENWYVVPPDADPPGRLATFVGGHRVRTLEWFPEGEDDCIEVADPPGIREAIDKAAEDLARAHRDAIDKAAFAGLLKLHRPTSTAIQRALDDMWFPEGEDDGD